MVEVRRRILQVRPEFEATWRMLQHVFGIYIATNDDEANEAPGTYIDAGRVPNGRIEGTNNRLSVLNASPTDSATPTTSQPESSSSHRL